MLKELFGQASARWIRYGSYIYKEADNGELYLTPTSKCTSGVYNPLETAETMVVDALNVGLLCMSSEVSEGKIQDAVLAFVEMYGLMGLMTALPTTPEFMDFETVYLPKNRFITAQSMPTEEYTALFFPFDEDKTQKDFKPKRCYVGDDGSIRVSLAARDKPKAFEMSFQRSYAERYEWLKTLFKDWAFSFCASFMYYKEKDPLMAELHRKAITVFDGNVPTYHIELFDTPTIVWDFHSLLLMVQMMFSFMLTDKSKSLRSCKHCNRAFIASHPKAEFCGYQCKNKHNVYKSRGKKD